MKKLIAILPAGALVLFLLIQLIPYGRRHTNPPVVKEPNWDSQQTRALAQRACFDCHSNQTNWYWYTNVAPFSWLIQRDVDEGRARLNFSEWDGERGRRGENGEGREVGDISEVVLDGEMPPGTYTIIHPSASLSDAEKQQLANGLNATLSKP